MTNHPIHLQEIAYSDLPGWALDDQLAAFTTFVRSAIRLLERDQLAANSAWRGVFEAAIAGAGGIADRTTARAFFEARLRPHAVGHAGPTGLLTGYYEPELLGSLEPTSVFTVPLYRRPADLENVVAESERGVKGIGLTHVRRTVQGVEPFATRQEIELGALGGQGLELLYLADPVEAFFLHVQGSGVICLPDGRRLRVTYDGKNGHPYTSVGRTMIEDGHFTADQLSLPVMGEWLRSDLERARTVLWRNASFIFFKKLDADRPVGALEIGLTAGRSLAVDTSYHALGTPVYVSSPTLTHAGDQTGFHRLMVAQDVGSAITGPERGDLYFGSGPDAGALAGITKHPGAFYVLAPVGLP
jgi:membrane-bound lytic murein transglycosylase A